MCSLIVARGLQGGPELFVIHNRDERLDRPARPPEPGRAGPRQVVCPRDEKAGGTWLGLNDVGVMAAITNRFGAHQEPGHRTRGELPLMALEAADAEEASARVAELSCDDYPGFHLFVADARRAFVIWNDQRALRKEEILPGVFVMTERSFGAAPSARLEFLQERTAGVERWPDEGRRFFEALMLHQDPQAPLESTCICMGPLYGTRCSTQVQLADGQWSMAYLEGPPCREGAVFEPVRLWGRPGETLR